MNVRMCKSIVYDVIEESIMILYKRTCAQTSIVLRCN